MSGNTLIALAALIVAILFGALQYINNRRNINILKQQLKDGKEKTESLERLVANITKLIEVFQESHKSYERHLASLETIVKMKESKSQSSIEIETIRLEKEKIKNEREKRKAEQSVIDALFDLIVPE
jgi:septal ring factor EnvC (AmiA/AmiB activator)